MYEVFSIKEDVGIYFFFCSIMEVLGTFSASSKILLEIDSVDFLVWEVSIIVNFFLSGY